MAHSINKPILIIPDSELDEFKDYMGHDHEIFTLCELKIVSTEEFDRNINLIKNTNPDNESS